ncbi:MAG: ABC transporter substrate-binding protein, partial [Tepidiformaceae bacterium]
MSNRTLTLLMGVVAVLILVVGGIVLLGLTTGGSDNDSSNPSQTKAPGGDICSGNTLITYGDDPASVLDPIQVRDTTSSAYVVEIFSGLVTLDLNLKVQPDLASSWDISADRKTYTFHMRDTAVFQSGRPVTAQDIKYSLERAADPKNNSPTVTVYLGDIVGLKDRYAGKAQEISGVKVVDDRTIQIQIEEPEEFFLAELTYPVAFAVDHEQIEKNPRNWTQTPNGSGPFKLASFKPADEIRLVRNDRYYLGGAKLAEVDFELGGGSIVTRYQNNELHIGVVPGADIEDV